MDWTFEMSHGSTFLNAANMEIKSIQIIAFSNFLTSIELPRQSFACKVAS